MYILPKIYYIFLLFFVTHFLITPIHIVLCVYTIQVCEHYTARGLCTDFPDWSIAAAGLRPMSGRFVTGMTQQAEPDLNEEPAGNDEVVPDSEEMSLVATSAEVCTMYIFHLK